ncbi:N-terminal double-transmembrane domain-containing protein [Enhydrobacter aerosaccus]|uniref:N-terminal double-transmembrane domain-containing protein n=1 Tax=Enhydrobacter aerosaccus TaxID=225324 RepID=A0A1T4PDJ2_9HYPH|nr:DUF4159 domain-containing protein [Enhydrobacter aerosaccus]SJZ89645.1 N-terminal double-transmembrane domain-containing protein [Enhydrobacter aerosaccus]
MLNLGAFAFAAPGMLALLLVLPVIYWLLRMIPPLPRIVQFPAIRLLIGLEPTEQTPMKMPWWLLLLRLLLAIALIVAVARPILNPQADLPGHGPLLLMIDDGWASAPGWATRITHAERLIDRAERSGRPVIVMGTAPAPLDAPTTRHGALRPEEARTLLRAFRPKPWPTDRAAAAAELDRMQVDPAAYAVWLSDGLQDAGTDALSERLRRFSGLQVILPDQVTTPLVLLPPDAEGRDLKVRALRPVADGPRRAAIQAADDQGRVVARIELDFPATGTQGEGVLPAPAELRNRMARLDIENQGGAGSAVLLDERHRRRPVSILGERAAAAGQPLLQEVYFLERALDPYVSLSIGDRENVLNRNTAVLLIPDSSAPSPADREEIAKWIESGGVAVRFAGPNLAAGGDTLVPTPLRLGDRALGGVMSWGKPATLADFPTNSPFFGIPIPKDVRISQQVLAEPTPDLADKTWARLTDGTPLVTAEKRGQGYLVLVHTTANTGWSNLALSGLFVDMLQRLVLLSRGVAGDGINKALKPWRTLDGFGRLGAPPAGAQMLPADADKSFKPGPTTPPGLYGDENAQVAFNLGDHVAAPKPLVVPSGASTDRLSEGGETDLSRWFLLAAAILLLADLLISLWLRGMFPRALRLRRAVPAALALTLFGFLATPPDIQAQQPARPPVSTQAAAPATDAATAAPPLTDAQALRGALDVRLAYIVTGDKDVDDTSRAGLEGLSEVLRNRTSVEPADPVALDLDRDEPRLYPLIYWPITATQPNLSPRASAALDRYLRTGGIIFIDTRDQQMSFDRPVGGNPDLKRLLGGIEMPPLVSMPPDHVLTKSFYLLSDMPGRWQGGKIWIEAGNGRVNDGVSTILIGSNDYAGAWAVDQRGRGLLPVSPGGETQREMAYRFGVNLVMHALTGNYKDDQVHIQDIMQRLRR